MYLSDCVGCDSQLGAYGYHEAGPRPRRRPGKVSHAKHQRRARRLIYMPRAGGDLNEFYEDGRLGSFWTKLRDKVVVPVAHIGAAVVTGGASLAASAAILKAQAEQKAAKAAADQQAQIQREQIAAAERVAMATATPSVAPAASPTGPTPSIAPPAQLVQQQMPQPTLIPTMSTMLSPSSSGPTYIPVPQQAPSGQPPWLIPAAIGGAGLLLIIMMGNRRAAPAPAAA